VSWLKKNVFWLKMGVLAENRFLAENGCPDREWVSWLKMGDLKEKGALSVYVCPG